MGDGGEAVGAGKIALSDNARCSLYNEPVATGGNGELVDGFFKETCSYNKCSGGGDKQAIAAGRLENYTKCTMNMKPELDFSFTSPQDETEDRIMDSQEFGEPCVAMEDEEIDTSVGKDMHHFRQSPNVVNMSLEVINSDITAESGGFIEARTEDHLALMGKMTDASADKISKSSFSSQQPCFLNDAPEVDVPIHSAMVDDTNDFLELSKNPVGLRSLKLHEVENSSNAIFPFPDTHDANRLGNFETIIGDDLVKDQSANFRSTLDDTGQESLLTKPSSDYVVLMEPTLVFEKSKPSTVEPEVTKEEEIHRGFFESNNENADGKIKEKHGCGSPTLCITFFLLEKSSGRSVGCVSVSWSDRVITVVRRMRDVLPTLLKANISSNMLGLHLVTENLDLSKSRELQIAKKSLIQRNLGSFEVNSWPKNKRRKIQDQEADSISASPSFRVTKHYPGEMGSSTSTKEVGENVEMMPEHASLMSGITEIEVYQKVACQLIEEMESSPKLQSEKNSVNSEGPDPARVSHGCLIEEMNLADSSSDARKESSEEDDQYLLPHECGHNLAYSEGLVMDRSLLEGESYLRVDGQLSCGLVWIQSKRDLDLTGAGETMPVLESFNIDPQTESEEVNISGHGINFDKFEFPRTSVERASILDQICKSTVMQTPLTRFSSAFKVHGSQRVGHSVPNGLLECMDLFSISALNEDVHKQIMAIYGNSSNI
ncbi:hypothetical protein ACH5RR_038081 [Cinchona calisaya]|uniref:Uncharacterized protein n=1 Tax=Cinchona calisaya TaxID=153742 RepID=A0ABD2YB19_9GENT